MKSQILIADSDAQEILQLAAMMEDKYQLDDVNNGAGCLKTISNHNPDLIILDDMIQDSHCYEVCQQLKSNPSTQQIPIILISDLQPDEIEDEIGYIGSDDYISRPINTGELLAKVETLLSFQSDFDDDISFED